MMCVPPSPVCSYACVYLCSERLEASSSLEDLDPLTGQFLIPEKLVAVKRYKTAHTDPQVRPHAQLAGRGKPAPWEVEAVVILQHLATKVW